MQKWEYLVVHVGLIQWVDSKGRKGELVQSNPPRTLEWFENTHLLASLGEEGWELAGTVTLADFKGGLIFKRPKP